MSASALGTRLLAEVQEEGLDELLRDLRTITRKPSVERLGVPQIDKLLDVFRFTPPTASLHEVGSLSSPFPGRNLQDVGGNTSSAQPSLEVPRPGPKSRLPVIEVTSQQPCAGKTNLLYFLAAMAVLPVVYGGKGQAVVWIDADSRFSATRMYTLLASHVSRSGGDFEVVFQKEIAEEGLDHIHVFKPQSSDQLLVTLRSLPDYLLREEGTNSHRSGSKALGSIILDSATAFYWRDRFDADVARLERAGTDRTASAGNTIQVSKTTEIINHLKVLQKTFDCSILFSTNHLAASPRKPRLPLDPIGIATYPSPIEPSRYSPWSMFATLTLSISPVPVPPFAPHMSLEQCENDQPNRLAAMEKGKFVVSIDRRGEESWPSHVKGAVASLDGSGSFGIRITREGVVVDDTGCSDEGQS